MLRRVLKVIGIVLGVLVGLIVIALLAINILGNNEIYRKVTVPAESVTIPTDDASIKEGERLVQVYGCNGCHTANFGGKIFIDDPQLGRIISANLTRGKGGIGGELTDDDWVRVLRHGVKPDGTRVIIMPAEEFTHLNASTLGKIIAYLKSVPPVDNELPKTEFHLLGQVLILTGKFNPFPYEFIDHSAPIAAEVPPGPTVEYGRYLAQVCAVCHGPGFSGGPMKIAPPNAPKSGNLTGGLGGIGKWTKDDFIHALRTGDKPDGGVISSEFMPWPSFAHMTDGELTALYLYFQTLPPKASGNQ